MRVHADPAHAEERARERLARVAWLEDEFGLRMNEAGLRLLRRVQFAAYLDLRGRPSAEAVR